MRLIRIFELANNIEGVFVEVGFGKGDTAKATFGAMNSGKLTKRNSYLIDSFKGLHLPTTIDLSFDSSLYEGKDPGRYQTAMDMRYELGNHHSISVIKTYVGSHLYTNYSGETIACLHIDLPSYTATVDSLELFKPFLNRDAVVYVSGYGDSLGVTRAVDNYISDNLLNYQFFTHNYSSYIKNKIAPVFYEKPKTTREFDVPENLIEVERVKTIPFADRYIKPILRKFKPTKKILRGVTDITNSVSKVEIDTPEDTIPISRIKLTPFDDRYEKENIKKFKSTPIVKEGLNVVDKKVSR